MRIVNTHCVVKHHIRLLMAKTIPDMSMAARLKKARARVFSSAAAAAEALGMHPNTVRAHESGQNGVGYEDLVRYCRRYGVSVEWLIIGEGPEEPSLRYEDFTPPSTFEVAGVVQDGAWYPVADDLSEARLPVDVAGEPELVSYSDDRFPPEVIYALKVRTDWPRSVYPDGSVLFTVASAYVEYRPGDHVVVVRQRGGFAETSVRELVLVDPAGPLSEENVVLRALTSQAEPIPGFHRRGDEEMESIAVVVGSLVKRQVPGMSIQARREYERTEREERRRR